MKISNALLSVADKNGLPELARELVRRGTRIYATGGTAKILAQHNIPAADLSRVTGDAEILDGRVKTLNTNLHAAILSDPQNPKHAAELEQRGVPQIQLVAVNFYPFAKVAAAFAPESEIIENIDIGGPALVRAAAKGGRIALAGPQYYPAFLAALNDNGEIDDARVREFNAHAFAEVAALDADIANYFARQNAPDAESPPRVFLSLKKSGALRYGENPHQPAACYVLGRGAAPDPQNKLEGEWELISGDALSFNNILDAQSAWRAALSLGESADASRACAAVVVKHNNPCGAALASSPRAAFDLARRGDPLSAFGGVAAFSDVVDGETAEAMSEMFLELVVAPEFSPDARKIFAGKSRPRLALPPRLSAQNSEWRIVDRTVLWQRTDSAEGEDFQFKTQRAATDEELRALHFAWKIAASLKSNAVAFARGTALAGAGAGQSSRVDAAILARDKMARAEFTSAEKSAPLVAASDGFFPFADGARVLLEAGATALAHPGGSKRDADIVKMADEFGAALATTGKRHFRH